jgi:hypothetical protein
VKAAPGAQLPIEDIFGRDQFIANLWRVLEVNSVRMEAERRIGKTSILHKMEAEPPPGWEPVSLDLEQVHSATEFAEKVCEKIHGRLTGWKKQGQRIWSFLESLRGTQVGKIKFPEKTARPVGYWKTLLNHAVEDLVEQQHAVGRRVVFLFDEMPWMLYAIADPQREGAQTAMEVLDVLRSLRQSTTTGQGFRMVLCGSVGMHHILAELQRSGYRNQPVNDMMLIDVPPLERDVAAELATQMIAGEKLPGESNAASRIAEVTGGFPFYIHWLISRLSTQGRTATQTEIDDAVNWLLTADHDLCDLRHFLKRIHSYYPGVDTIVLAILDHAAKNQAPLTQADLINVGKSAGSSDDEQLRDLLCQLAMDHYLSRGTDGRYTFRTALLRRWWLIERGLE